ncbi:hypothetical protein GQ53DRAFT_835359 [Thozetella sp. PMI_491]|nr:hypothetical protein GQ53DRAFT_835359 [Thozetella sp. PMI_491]
MGGSDLSGGGLTGLKPSSDPPVRRGRKSAPRGRAGCFPCKDAHVRCPEERPQCFRCTRLRLPCRYPSAVQLSASDAAHMRIRTILPAVIPPPPRPPPSSGDLKEHDAIYLDWFRLYFAPGKNDSNFNLYSNFWLRTLPREAAMNEGIRRFVVSIGALDLAMRQLQNRPYSRAPGSSSLATWNVDYRAAMQSYSKAISLFRTQVADQSRPLAPRTFLLYCLLQCVFEGLQGNHEGYMRAMHTGFEVIKHRVMQDSRTSAADIDDEGITEAEMIMARTVAVSDLYGVRLDVSKASIKIPVPIPVSLPANEVSDPKACLIFVSFFSRAILWVVETAKSMGSGLADANQIFHDINIIISQLREWAAYLGTKASRSRNVIEGATLRVHQIEARFGVIFLLSIMRHCGWEVYAADCLSMLRLARYVVQDVSEKERSNSRIPQQLVTENLAVLVNHIIENCRHDQVREQGLEVLNMINDRYDIGTNDGFSTALTHFFLDTTGAEPKADEDSGPRTRYKIVRYTWDAEQEVFRITLHRFVPGGDGIPVEKVLVAPYGRIMSIASAAYGSGSPPL